jgi:hypothetical protein
VWTHTLSGSFNINIPTPELSFYLLLRYTSFFVAHESEKAQDGDDDVHDISFSEVKTKCVCMSNCNCEDCSFQAM